MESKQDLPVRRLLWDIETSQNIGVFWRSGHRITIRPEDIIHERAIICIAYKWEFEKKVNCLEWNRGCDKKMLKKFMKTALQADEMIAHNGDKFDIRWFNGRCLIHGLDIAPKWKTVDTLAISRSNFSLNSNTLAYLARVLGVSRKGNPGGAETWKKILLENCPTSMRKMTKYCMQDVKVLEDVWHKIKGYHKPKSHAGVLMGGEKWTCPWTGSENVVKSKTRTTAAGTVQHQMQCKDTGAYYTINDAQFKKYLKAKNK